MLKCALFWFECNQNRNISTDIVKLSNMKFHENPSCGSRHICADRQREADHSPPFSADINVEWSCTSTPPYTFLVFSGTILPLLYLPCLSTNARTSTVGIFINLFQLTFEALWFPKWFIYHRDFHGLLIRSSRLVAGVMRSQLTLQ